MHIPKQTVASPVVLHPVLRHSHTIVSINLGTTNKVVNAICWFHLSIQYSVNHETLNWKLAFLTSRHQTIEVGSHISSTLMLNTGAPQSCVPCPLLFTLYTHDCTPRHQENSIVNYVNDTNIIGHINNYLVVHRKPFTVQQTKKLVVDLMKKKRQRHTPLTTSVEVKWSRCTVLSSWESTS